ncbi:Calcium-transporting ATPase 1 [bioreactor metagenome]|uniref:Calcium-transporting ATPase 1 n=1 Tax=bioreactor metagenome TaxID=1076179 RepID=A0A645AU89_9ZZZZ
MSKTLSYLVLGICVFIFALSVIRTGFAKDTILDTFMIAVSLAVAAIPEGLAAVVTIVLSIGVTNMSHHNAIIRKLTAVETLGCAQVICSDKTGTLTQNKMTVVDSYADNKELLAKAMALCSDAELEGDNVIGEPTECALVAYAKRSGYDKNVLKGQYPRVDELPFDSKRKMMSTIHQDQQGYIQFTKGAPDEIFKHCVAILQNGKEIHLTDELRAAMLTENKRMADQALRVLAAAYRLHDERPGTIKEEHLIFIGLCGMIDPIRPEVKDAIRECRSAHIRPVMITGDHFDTAVAIAKQLDIIQEASEAITGSQLNEIDDETLAQNIGRYSVYARVQPEHKVRIVNAWQAQGKIVAMTGDGVNDAPSIKHADIGVGMGITGTDVTKNVADMVLADDNFATIVNAVGEGRRVYDNIRKAIQFLLGSNMSEVLSIFFATILGFTILKPTHLLWINLITDSFPALSLGMEAAETDIMARKPRDSKEGIFANGLGFDVAYQGVVITLVTLAAYFIGHFMEAGVWEITESPDGMTMAFLTLSMAEIFHSYNMRSQRKSLFQLNNHNWYLFGAMVLSFILTSVVIYVPFFAEAFAFETISIPEYAVAIALAFTVIPIVEIVKLFQRKLNK